VSGSSGSGDPVLWKLRGERVKLFLIRMKRQSYMCTDGNRIAELQYYSV